MKKTKKNNNNINYYNKNNNSKIHLHSSSNCTTNSNSTTNTIGYRVLECCLLLFALVRIGILCILLYFSLCLLNIIITNIITISSSSYYYFFQQQQQQEIQQNITTGIDSNANVDIFNTTSNFYQWAKPSSTYTIDWNDKWELKDDKKYNEYDKIPIWLQHYFRWHKETRQQLIHYLTTTTSTTGICIDTSNAFNNIKIIHVVCLQQYTIKCGGTADRLYSLPFIILIAARTQRLLLIQWDRPTVLEDFLIPNNNTIDWRVPNNTVVICKNEKRRVISFSKYIGQIGYRVGTEESIILATNNNTIHVVQIKFQSHDHGSIYYNTNVPKIITTSSNNNNNNNHYNQFDNTISLTTPFDIVFSIIWDCMFIPVPRIQQSIQNIITANQLTTDSNYIAVHVRALYNVKYNSSNVQQQNLIHQITINSINCAYHKMKAILLSSSNNTSTSNMNENINIYFASDSSYALERAIQYGNSISNAISTSTSTSSPTITIITSSSSSSNTNTNTLIWNTQRERQVVSSSSVNSNPLHLDKVKNWKQHDVSDFDTIFIDLYLMGMSSCVLYGIGGYGKLSSVLRIQSSNNQQQVRRRPLCSIKYMNATAMTQCPKII